MNRNLNSKRSILVSKSQFAALAGINPSSVTKLCRTGSLVSNSSGLLDLLDRENKSYLLEKWLDERHKRWEAIGHRLGFGDD